MNEKIFRTLFSLCLIWGVSAGAIAAKVPAPDEGGDGFKAVGLEEAQELRENGAVVVACHSHTTDFMKGHPPGTVHITCLVPKGHKRTDLPLDEIDFDVAQLPADKSTPIVTYCASST
jgi:rhodanese-related sulfurtransferase